MGVERAGSIDEALRYALLAEQRASQVPGIEGVPARDIKSVGVIGSGTMGCGITLALLTAGIPVILCECGPDALERGLGQVRRTIDRNVRSGRIGQAAADAALTALRPAQVMAELAEVDLVVEAAYETMAVKREIFAALNGIARQGAILATNTSYLDIDEIASATHRPSDVIGLHFFSPANVMKLLEVVRGKSTSPNAIATAFALAERIGKIAVLSANARGFIGNRMLARRRQQAEAMAVEGASLARIDAVLEGFGLAMGPFRVGDLAGLDLGWSLETSTGSTIRERLCEAGRRWQKSGAGFYDYDETRKPTPSDEAQRIIAGFARDTSVTQRAFSDKEILDRLIWPMVDEGASILAEGVALRESDIDAVWLNGYGWPRATGGPMFHARRTGLNEVVRRLDAMGIEVSGALRNMAYTCLQR